MVWDDEMIIIYSARGLGLRLYNMFRVNLHKLSARGLYQKYFLEDFLNHFAIY